MKRSQFFEKTLIMIISNVFTGTLTFGFSILLSRRIGSAGMGLYQLVMPLYVMFLCITGGGITVSVSKLAAEEKARKNLKELYRTVRATCLFEFVWSVIITIILIFSSFYISGNILNDKRTIYSIFAFCPAIIIVSISSVYKGVYYGLQRVVEPAIIDIIEKIIRLTVMILAFTLIGKTSTEFSAAIAILSLSAGELTSLILFYICYRSYVKKNPGFGSSDNGLQLVVNVLRLAIPLAINGILATIFATVITIIIPRRLQVAGLSYEDSLALLGKIQGMAMTIAFYPTIIISSLNVLLIPSISEAVTFKKSGIVNHRINTGLRIAAITAFSSAAIIFSIPAQLGEFFFKDGSIGDILLILAPGLPLVYFQIITFAILNGLGKQKSILINSTILSIIDLVLLYILLGIPSLYSIGYGIDFVVSAALGIILNVIVIKKSVKYKFDFFNTIIIPFLCSVLSYFFIKYGLHNLNNTALIICCSYLIFSVLYFPSYRFSSKSYKKNSV